MNIASRPTYPDVGSLLLGQEPLDLLSEVVQRSRAAPEDTFDRVVSSRLAEEERRRSLDPRRYALRVVD